MHFKGKREETSLGGPVVKNSPSRVEDTGSIPSRGTKIPHAVPWATLRESPHAATKTQCGQSKNKHTKKWKRKQGCWCPMVMFVGHRTYREGREDQGWKQTAVRSVLAPGTMLLPTLSPAVCDCPLRAPLLSACPHSILASHRLTLKSVIVTTYLVKHDQRPPPVAPRGLSAGPSTNRALVGCPVSLTQQLPWALGAWGGGTWTRLPGLQFERDVRILGAEDTPPDISRTRLLFSVKENFRFF